MKTNENLSIYALKAKDAQVQGPFIMKNRGPKWATKPPLVINQRVIKFQGETIELWGPKQTNMVAIVWVKEEGK